MNALLLPIEDFDATPATLPEPPPIGCGCARCRNDPDLPPCRADAWQEGLRLGRAEQAQLLAAQAATLDATLRAALADSGQQAADIAEATAEAIGRAVIALAAAALPATFARLGAEEARRVAEAVLPALRAEPAVTIRAAPEAIALLDRLPAARAPRITLEATNAEPGDIAIAWHGGGTSRTRATALANATTVLEEFGLVPALQEEPVHG